MLAESRDDPRGESASPPLPITAVGLSWLDRLAFRNFVAADEETYADLLAQVRESATALAGPDRGEARMRILARALAAERVRELLVSAKLDECLAVRDFAAAVVLEKVLMGTTRRMALLMGEHRAACEAEQRRAVMVAVGHATNVTIRAGR